MFRPVSKTLRAASFFIAHIYLLGNLLSFTGNTTETILFIVAATYLSIPAVVVSLGVQARPRFKYIRAVSYFIAGTYVMSNVMLLAGDFVQRLLLVGATSYVTSATTVATLFAGTQQSAPPETKGLNQEKIS